MRIIEPPDGRPWALLGLCGASLLLNVALLAQVVLGGPPASEDAAARALVPQPSPVAAVASPGDDVELEPEPAAQDLPEGVRVVRADVVHSLARTFQRALPEDHADVVSAVYARLFVWDLDLRKDLQRGDRVTVAYEWDGTLAHIPVAAYRSGKLGTELVAYRFHATGDEFPSWWDASGVEVPRRLNNGPLRDYEQVTSLLRDRPRHRGMDFKLPEGRDVLSPQAGAVVRTNWNLAYNGGCVEVRYDDGTVARFLHLADTSVDPGQRVGPGTVIGHSGNSGRSTAPHLHYELERGGKVVDPVEHHGTSRRALSDADRARFELERTRLDALLANAS